MFVLIIIRLTQLFADSARAKLRKSWIGDMSSARFTNSLWKEFSKSGAEKRTDTLVYLVNFFFFATSSFFEG